MGEYLMGRLRDLAKTHPTITEVRGRGLMVAAEVGVPSDQVVAACLARGLLVNNVRPTSVRLVPPLIVTRAEIDEAIGILGAALADVARASTEAATASAPGAGPRAAAPSRTDSARG
jgi:4-aminobutyrate aminotransferase-like enzyme